MKQTMLALLLFGSLAQQTHAVCAKEKTAAPAPTVPPVATPNPDPYSNETREQRDARFGLFIPYTKVY
jgi:hypothetical protein